MGYLARSTGLGTQTGMQPAAPAQQPTAPEQQASWWNPKGKPMWEQVLPIWKNYEKLRQDPSSGLKKGSSEDTLLSYFRPTQVKKQYEKHKGDPIATELLNQYYSNFGEIKNSAGKTIGQFGHTDELMSNYAKEKAQLERALQPAIQRELNLKPQAGRLISPDAGTTSHQQNWENKWLPVWKDIQAGKITDDALSALTSGDAPKKGGFMQTVGKIASGMISKPLKSPITSLLLAPIAGPIFGKIGGMASKALGGGIPGAIGSNVAQQALGNFAFTGKPRVDLKSALAAGASSAFAPKAISQAAPTTGGTKMNAMDMMGMAGGNYYGGGAVPTGGGGGGGGGFDWGRMFAPAVGGYITGGKQGAGAGLIQGLMGQYGDKLFGQSDIGEALQAGVGSWAQQELFGQNANQQNFTQGVLGNVAGQGSSPWNQMAGQVGDVMGYQNQQNQLIQQLLPQLMGMMGGMQGGQQQQAPATQQQQNQPGFQQPGYGQIIAPPAPQYGQLASERPDPRTQAGGMTSGMLSQGMGGRSAEDIYGGLMGQERRLLDEAVAGRSRSLENMMGRRGLGASSIANQGQADLNRDYMRELAGASQANMLNVANVMGGQGLTQRGQSLQAGGLIDQLRAQQGTEGLRANLEREAAANQMNLSNTQMGNQWGMSAAEMANRYGLGYSELGQAGQLSREQMRHQAGMQSSELANRQSLANQASRGQMYSGVAGLIGQLLGGKLFPQPERQGGGGDDTMSQILQLMQGGGGGGGYQGNVQDLYSAQNNPGTWNPPEPGGAGGIPINQLLQGGGFGGWGGGGPSWEGRNWNLAGPTSMTQRPPRTSSPQQPGGGGGMTQEQPMSLMTNLGVGYGIPGGGGRTPFSGVTPSSPWWMRTPFGSSAWGKTQMMG